MAEHSVPGFILEGTPIGQGAMGVVYRAWEDSSLAVERAIKILEPHPFYSASGSEERFAKETQALRQLQHRAIVRYVSSGFTAEGRRPFLVMEYVEGKKLSQAASSMPFEERAAVILDVLDGLAYAHSQGIFHRDIKPGNIMLRASDGQAVIVDFGLAHVPDPSAGPELTKSTIGTQGYIPQEVLADPRNSRGPNHDIYSAGVTLYEILAGLRPNIQSYVPLASVDGRLAGLDPIVLQALAEEKRRFASMTDFADVLRRWSAQDAARRQLAPSPFRNQIREKLMAADRDRNEEAELRASEEQRRKVAWAEKESIVVAATIDAFRETFNDIADIRPNLQFIDDPVQARRVQTGRRLVPICLIKYTDSDRRIIFARTADPYDPLDLNWRQDEPTNQWSAVPGYFVGHVWVIYTEGSTQAPQRILYGGVAATSRETDPLDPKFALELSGRPGLHPRRPPMALTSVQDIKDYVVLTLADIFIPLQ